MLWYGSCPQDEILIQTFLFLTFVYLCSGINNATLDTLNVIDGTRVDDFSNKIEDVVENVSNLQIYMNRNVNDDVGAPDPLDFANINNYILIMNDIASKWFTHIGTHVVQHDLELVRDFIFHHSNNHVGEPQFDALKQKYNYYYQKFWLNRLIFNRTTFKIFASVGLISAILYNWKSFSGYIKSISKWFFSPIVNFFNSVTTAAESVTTASHATTVAAITVTNTFNHLYWLGNNFRDMMRWNNPYRAYRNIADSPIVWLMALTCLIHSSPRGIKFLYSIFFK